MTTELARKQASPIQTLRGMLESKPMLAEINKALPNGWTAEKFVRTAITAAQKNPRIADCTAVSVAGSLMECAQLGLEPDPTLGHAYLVPFKNNRKGVYECTMIPGYRGFISLAKRAGGVNAIFAEVVRKDDQFQIMYGTTRGIVHIPNFPQSQSEKDWTGVYAVIEYADGGRDFEYLEPADWERSRNRSRAKDDGPWVTDTEDMVKKTAIRKLCKRLDLSPEDKRLPKLAALDEYREAGVARKVGLGVDDYDIGAPELEALPGPVEREDAPEPSAVEQGQAEGHATEPVATGNRPAAAKAPKSPAKAKSEDPKPVGKPISEPKRIDLFREAEKHAGSGATDWVLKIIAKYGFKKSGDVTEDKYDAILAEIRAGGYPDK